MENKNTKKLRLNLYKDPDKQVKFLIHFMLTFRLLPETVAELFGLSLDEINEMLFYKNFSTTGLDYLINHEALDQTIPKQQAVAFYNELVTALKDKDNVKVNVMLNELYDKRALELARSREKREDITDEMLEVTLKYQLKYGLPQTAIVEIFNFSRRGYQPRLSEYLKNHPDLQRRYEYLADYMQTFSGGTKIMSKASVYIHIPFCKSICAYCDFCKVLYNKEWTVAYLKKLKDEIKDRYMGESVKTIYIGGGTPSALSLKEIEYLLTLTKLFKIDELEEFTFECNIEDITEELLELLSKFNVNRLSIGIESFNEENLLLMKRKVDYKDTVKKMELIRSKDFNNVNLDLIYALPSEKLRILKKDIKLLLSLNPEHISTYSLMIEDNTFLSYKKTNNIKEELDAEMYEYICKKLKKNGYNHYEISNFAKDGFESKHNLVYWNNNEYYGFGCGASGYIAGVRYDNTRSLSKYLNGEVNSSDNLLSAESIMEYELILGLRKTSGIKLQDFYNKYKVNMQDVFPIKPLIKNGDLIYKDGYIKINPKKLYVMNEILLKLV